MKYINVDNNIKIAVEDLGNKKDRPLVFIHGWPLNHKIFEYQTDILLKNGFRIISVDLRGFGKSDVTADGYTYDRMAKDINTIIEKLELTNVILVGFSMGGAIAIRYMSLFKGKKIKKLALLAAAAPCFTKRDGYPYGMSAEDVDKLIEQALHDRPYMAYTFGQNLFESKPSEQFLTWFNEISYNASGPGTIGTAKALRDEDLRNDIKNIQIETGIFHGKLDRICPYSFAELLSGGIKNSKLYSYEHSGHGVFYDELEKFNEEFISFLKG